MGKIYKNSPKYGTIGRDGVNVYYQKNGQTMVAVVNDSPRSNNTYGQILQKCKWGNLVQSGKGFARVIQGAFQYKSGSQTDFNLFIKNNLTQSIAVYLTKEESELKTAILAPYILSQGDVDSIKITELNNGAYATDIKLSITIDSSTTISDLSKDIVNNNYSFDYGETITYIEAVQYVDPVTGVLKIRCGYSELNLDRDNLGKVVDVLHSSGFKNVNGFLGRDTLTDLHGFLYNHGRKLNNGKKCVSTQNLIVENSLLVNYTSDAAKAAAVVSYNPKNEAIVTPNSEGTSITGGYFDENVQPTPPTPTTPVTITAKVATGQESQGSVKAGSAAAGATSSVTVEKDTSVQVVATPVSGYKFKKWNTDETTATLNLIANADTTVTATFEPDSPTGTVTVTLTSAEPSQGKVQINTGEVGATATATVQSGAATVIKGIPEAGYTFSKWSDGGLQFERTITPTVDTSLTATFEAE